jgi:hypothetical protein
MFVQNYREWLDPTIADDVATLAGLLLVRESYSKDARARPRLWLQV